MKLTQVKESFFYLQVSGSCRCRPSHDYYIQTTIEYRFM